MTGPTLGPAQPVGETALTAEIGWVEEPTQLTETQAYWRLRGMAPPPDLPLEE